VWMKSWGPFNNWIPGIESFGSLPTPTPHLRSSSKAAKARGPKFQEMLDEDAFGKWTILCLEFSEVGGKLLPPIPAYSYDLDRGINSAFLAMKVKYACKNIPQSNREALLSRHLAGLNSNFGKQLTLLFEELHQIAKFVRHGIRDSTFTFEFKFRTGRAT